MAKQKIMPGGSLDIPTEEEIARMFAPARPRVVLGMGGATQEKIVDDIPMRGTRRQLTSHNRGDGGDNFVVPAAAVVDLTDLTESRIAGTVINIGTNPCTIYLAKASRVIAQGNPGTMAGGGIICGYMFGTGGEWDFKLSNDVWCGPVSVWSLLGTTLVWGVH